MSTPATCHALTTYYVSTYDRCYGRKPVINRNKARWGWENILEDLSPSESRNLLDYYFETSSTHGHSLDWFFNNYDKLIVKKRDSEKDEEDRARLRAESKKRVEEWRKKHIVNDRGESPLGGM